MENVYLKLRLSCPLLSDCINTLIVSSYDYKGIGEVRLITDHLISTDKSKETILLLSESDPIPKRLFDFAGIICRQGGFKEFELCLNYIKRGMSYYSPIFIEKEKMQYHVKDNYNLSKREWEVLRKIADGYTTNEIASLLFISPSTVEVHRTHIQTKLGLKGSNCLIKFATKYFTKMTIF